LTEEESAAAAEESSVVRRHVELNLKMFSEQNLDVCLKKDLKTYLDIYE